MSKRTFEIVDVIPSEQPQINETVNYWIRLPEGSQTVKSNKYLPKGDVKPRQGFIVDVDMAQKVLKVIFEDSGKEMREEQINFNMPGLVWFRETGPLVEKDL